MSCDELQARDAAPPHRTQAYGQRVAPGYKRTEIGVIPEDWSFCSLFELAGESKSRFDDGDWVEAEFLTESGVRLLQTGNIGVGEFVDKESRKYISDNSFAFLRCKDVQPGDLLICRLAEPAGRACIVPDLGEQRMITSVDVTIFRPVPELADSRFLLHVFGTRKWFADVSDRCGGSTRSRIARGQLAKIKVQAPTVPEQRAIAEALSDVDGLLGALEALIAKKRAIKQAAMQQLLTGKTRLPGFSGEWEKLLLGDAERRGDLRLYRGKVISQRDIDQSPGDYPIYSSSVHSNGLFGYYGFYMLDEELVTWSVDGGGHFFYRPRHRFSVTNVCGYIRCRSENINCRYLAYHLQELHSRKFFDYTMKAHPSVIRNSYELLLPSIDEQKAIATVLSDMDTEITALEARRDKTRQIKQGMMQQLLTGRVRLVKPEEGS